MVLQAAEPSRAGALLTVCQGPSQEQCCCEAGNHHWRGWGSPGAEAGLPPGTERQPGSPLGAVNTERKPPQVAIGK